MSEIERLKDEIKRLEKRIKEQDAKLLKLFLEVEKNENTRRS